MMTNSKYNGQGDPLLSASGSRKCESQEQSIRDAMLHHDQFQLGNADPLFIAAVNHDEQTLNTENQGHGDHLMGAAMNHWGENAFGEMRNDAQHDIKHHANQTLGDSMLASMLDQESPPSY
jgi:hypothetical protein